MHSLGSGFIIDAAGWVVTNNHVIGDASEVSVTLNDGTQLPAEIKARDDKTDLALLKVNAANPLPFVAFGDSEKARVGDWVLAVGNPFGLGGTVTAGIISAHGRNINAGPYDDFIQTDAAINRGNSGGPMFNLAGEVIGINTAIFSPTGGNIGIGFAIPSNMAKMVVAELREKGHVDRGWLGVQIQSVTPDLASGLGIDQNKGALVADVIADTPAAQAGFQRGDVILRFGDHAVEGAHDLPRLVAMTAAGQAVPVAIVRNGKQETLQVTIGKMPSDQKVASLSSPESAKGQLGLSLSPITPQVREEMNLGPNDKGVVVEDVKAGSEAARKGVQPGDIIMEVNRSPVTKPADVAGAIDQAKRDKRKAVVLLLKRENSQRFVALNLPA
jgi:serine protease Do